MAGTVLVFSLLWVSTGISLAAPAKSLKDIGTSLLGIGGTIATFIVIGQIALALAGVLLTIASNILDFAFQWNTENIFTNIVSAGPITVFWGYARDIVNGLLILILLWIAFGIIFSLERFNARRLLVRVILVGLLINFSLTLTSSVFNFANALAKPFAEQLKKAGGPDRDPKTGTIKTDSAGKPIYRGISTKIVEITNVHTAMNAAAKNVERIKAIAEQQQAAVQLTPQEKSQIESIETFEGPATQIFAYNTITQQTSQVRSLPGTNEAEAVAPLLIPLAWGAIKLVGGTIALSGITMFLQQFTLGGDSFGPIGVVSAQAFALFLNPFVGALFLLVATFVIGSLAILFLARGIVIILLAILSPLAFAALIIPGQDKYWKMWLGKLINWSFFAPISFFLLLFAMHVGDRIQALTAAEARGVELQANLPAAFQFALILGLLISALAIAKYMGIQLAATLMKAGEGYAKKGLGVAKGFAVGAAAGTVMPRLGALSSRLEEAIGKRSPALQRVLALPTAGLRKVAAVSRKQVEEAGKGMKEKTTREIKRALAAGSFLTMAENMEAARTLQERGDLGAEADIKGYSPEMLDRMVEKTWQIGGEWQSFGKVLPTLTKDKYLSADALDKAKEGFKKAFRREAKADESSQWFMWQKIKPADMTKMDYSTTFSSGNEERDNLMKEMYLRVARGEHHSQFARTNPAKAAEVIGHLKTTEGKKIVKDWTPGQFAYWSTSTARELGLSSLLPADAEKPEGIVKEEELRKTAENLRVAVRDAERKLEQVKRIEERSRELKTKRDALVESLTEVRRKLSEAASAEERNNLGRSVADINREIRKIEDIDLPTVEKQKEGHLSERRVTDFSEVLRKYEEDIEATRENLRKTREELRGIGGLGGRIEI